MIYQDCNKLIRDSGLESWVKDVSSDISIKNKLYIYSKNGDEIVNVGFRDKRMGAYGINIYNGLASVIQQVPGLPINITVYRGVHNYNNLDKINVGETINNVGFISTSLDKYVAMKFSGDIIFNIEVPAGVKALFLSPEHGTSEYYECEIVLPLNPVFQVVNKTVGKYDTVLEVKLIDFNTPTEQEIINMYDPTYEINYYFLFKLSKEGNVFILNGKSYTVFVGNRDYINITKNKSELEIYKTNISVYLFGLASRNSTSQYRDMDNNLKKYDVKEFNKRQMKSIIVNNKEYLIVYTRVYVNA